MSFRGWVQFQEQGEKSLFFFFFLDVSVKDRFIVFNLKQENIYLLILLFCIFHHILSVTLTQPQFQSQCLQNKSRSHMMASWVTKEAANIQHFTFFVPDKHACMCVCVVHSLRPQGLVSWSSCSCWDWLSFRCGIDKDHGDDNTVIQWFVLVKITLQHNVTLCCNDTGPKMEQKPTSSTYWLKL